MPENISDRDKTENGQQVKIDSKAFSQQKEMKMMRTSRIKSTKKKNPIKRRRKKKKKIAF